MKQSFMPLGHITHLSKGSHNSYQTSFIISKKYLDYRVDHVKKVLNFFSKSSSFLKYSVFLVVLVFEKKILKTNYLFIP